jgi:hypothetical protein
VATSNGIKEIKSSANKLVMKSIGTSKNEASSTAKPNSEIKFSITSWAIREPSLFTKACSTRDDIKSSP